MITGLYTGLPLIKLHCSTSALFHSFRPASEFSSAPKQYPQQYFCISTIDLSNCYDCHMMKAIVCTGYGSPDVLELRKVAEPTQQDDEVLVKVHASAVTSGDARIRALRAPKGFRLIVRLAFGFTTLSKYSHKDRHRLYFQPAA